MLFDGPSQFSSKCKKNVMFARFILNMMFARFKFVVKRYCVHTFYKSRALTAHSVFRLLCVVTFFKYIHGAASAFQLSDL